MTDPLGSTPSVLGGRGVLYVFLSHGVRGAKFAGLTEREAGRELEGFQDAHRCSQGHWRRPSKGLPLF